MAENPTARHAAEEFDAREPSHLLAWGLVLAAAVLVAVAPFIGLLLTAAAAFVAHTRGADTPRIAAAALFVVALILVIFRGGSGLLGGGLFNA